MLPGESLVHITSPSMRCLARGSLPAELPPLLLKQRIGAPVVEVQLAAAAAAVPLAQMLLLLLLLMMFPVSVVSRQSLEKRSTLGGFRGQS